MVRPIAEKPEDWIQTPALLKVFSLWLPRAGLPGPEDRDFLMNFVSFSTRVALDTMHSILDKRAQRSAA